MVCALFAVPETEADHPALRALARDPRPAAVPPFDRENTTAELLARFFYVEAGRRLQASDGGRVTVSKVEVWENDGSLAVYREE